MPENERNNFPNPSEGLHPLAQTLTPEDEIALDVVGNRFLRILRKLKSKMTIKTFLAIVRREAEQNFDREFIAYQLNEPTPVEYGDFQTVLDHFPIKVIKYLANGGFIKLSNAANFESREIVKYHATAQPKFRSGKFQL